MRSSSSGSLAKPVTDDRPRVDDVGEVGAEQHHAPHAEPRDELGEQLAVAAPAQVRLDAEPVTSSRAPSIEP